MTTDKYKLRDTVSEYCKINPVLLDDFLNKLSPDDLEVLEMIVKDAYKSGEDSDSRYNQSRWQRGYDVGYAAGYEDAMSGLSSEASDNDQASWERGYEAGLAEKNAE